MQNNLKFSLPFPPSVNHYWESRICGNRIIRFISEKGKAFRKDVIYLVKAQNRQEAPIASKVAVEVILHAPDKRKRDLDNHGGKALLDALTHASVWLDDSLVDKITMQWGDIVKGGSCDVSISPL